MGSTGLQHSRGRKLKADEIRMFIESIDNNGLLKEWKYTTIKSNVAYGYFAIDGKPQHILVTIIKNGKNELVYKEMTEMDGPCQYGNVPKKLLEMVPCPKDNLGNDQTFAKLWREKANAWHLGNNGKVSMYHQLKIGHIIEHNCDMNSPHGNLFTITEINVSQRTGRKTFFGTSKANGMRYKIIPNKVKFILATMPKTYQQLQEEQA